MCVTIYFRATWRSFMMRRLKTRRAPQRSHGIPSITRPPDSLFPPQTKIILFAQTRRNSRVRWSPPFINSSFLRRRSFFHEFRVLPRIIASRCSARERRSQQTEKQRQATGDEIRAGPLIRREKPRRSVGRFVSSEFVAQSAGRPARRRESRKTIRLDVAMGIIIPSDSHEMVPEPILVERYLTHHERWRCHLNEWVSSRNQSRGISFASTTLRESDVPCAVS